MVLQPQKIDPSPRLGENFIFHIVSPDQLHHVNVIFGTKAKLATCSEARGISPTTFVHKDRVVCFTCGVNSASNTGNLCGTKANSWLVSHVSSD